jgi:LacI family transcriptional regulator
MANNQTNKIITQEDVARRAGVTRSIVSYVINNGPRKVSAATRSRVLSAIKELGYRPNKHAQILSSADDNTTGNYIGIILANNMMFRRPYYGSILASIHEHAHNIGWHVRFIRVSDDFCDPALFDELIHPNEIRGIVLIGLDQSPIPACDMIMVAEIVQRVPRVVCVDWEWPGVPSIQFDHQTAALQATNHLLDCGRKHIVYMGPEDKRLAGYQQALWGRGITPRELYVCVESQTGYEQCSALLQSGLPIDAICAGTDEAAIGILNCLYMHGLSVPGDIAVASIDNIEMSSFTVPPLTTIDVPKHEMGRHAIDILVSDQVWKASSAFGITVPTQLIVRDTSRLTPREVTDKNVSV